MATRTVDAVVIGAGTGGYPCAIRLGQLKQKVIIVEKDEVGGVCLNWGCIPSKALISASHTYEKAKNGATMGLLADNVRVDVPKMQEWKGGIVKKLTGGVRTLLKTNGAELIVGTARITGPNTVEITTREGQKETIDARAIVVATGSTTIEIPTFKFDGKQIIGAKEAVSLKEVPKRLLVIGGGVIGLELGTVYQKLGSELTVVEATPSLLPGTDPELTAVVERKLVKHGAKIFKNAKALGYEKNKDGSLAVKVDLGEGKHDTLVVDTVLVSVGMRPNSAGFGLEELGVKIDKGFVPSDLNGRTNIPSIYSVGDVSGQPMLAHKATKEGEVVAEIIAGHKAAKDWVSIPGVIFTDPEIATGGLTEAQAKERGIDVRIGKFPFTALGKAMAINETDGFIKVVADKKSHELLGVHIVGPEASNMISEGMLALEMHSFLEDIGLTVHPHPTLGEAMMEAAQHALGHAIHIMNKNQ
ncbi:dihydrolipoyl dehydrogenase [Pendulispora rubella]|uniref:Dihydrolipoyl dehydrogenase n=1 Tax=Pendulispora rubella TaxID=2741070 RepID=A0ABZ2LK60_9BACT